MRKQSTATKQTKNTALGRPEKGDFFVMQSTKLMLADGTSYGGYAPAWQNNPSVGEVVFNTGMTGYVESLTDPSYAHQILVFTFPLIGNYGVQAQDLWESSKIHAAGVVVSEAALNWSHAHSYQSLLNWLHEQQVPLIAGVDTRSLTKHLRAQGTMLGTINGHTASLKPSQLTADNSQVSIDKPITYNEQYEQQVILVDCGTKRNILRSLLNMPVKVKRVPSNYDYTNEDYAGVVISNGPGDPTDYPETIAITKKALAKGKPVFGICLGSQIMALAAGAQTYKLQYGHRGHNQPAIASDTKHCYITSQNHGYAVAEKSLPKDWKVTFRNLNDQSVEGIAHKTKPFFAVQFHPEANPGPTDTAWLFERFYKSL